MFRRRLSTLLLATILTPVYAGIDLSPLVEEYKHAGFEYRKVTLKEDNGVVTFTPPLGWSVRGGKDRLHLTPPDAKFAEATVVAAPLKAPQALDEPAVKALKQQVLASAPPESQAVQLLDRQENPLTVGSHQTHQVAITYDLLGYTFHRSTIFVHTPDTLLVFEFSAPKADFEPMNEAFRRSISTWEWIEAKPRSSSPISSPGAG